MKNWSRGDFVQSILLELPEDLFNQVFRLKKSRTERITLREVHSSFSKVKCEQCHE